MSQENSTEKVSRSAESVKPGTLHLPRKDHYDTEPVAELVIASCFGIDLYDDNELRFTSALYEENYISFNRPLISVRPDENW